MKIFLLSTLLVLAFVHSHAQLGPDIEVVEDHYESGKLYSRYYLKRIDSTTSTQVGLLTYWYESGHKLSEKFCPDTGLTKYINCWTGDSVQICTNGNGRFYDIGAYFMDDSTVFTIKDSLRHGTYISYIPTGKGKCWKAAEGTFSNGLRQGEVTFYYETGSVLCTETYVNDKEDGVYKKYYTNGQLKETGFRKEYRKEGLWLYYSSQGVLTKEETYKTGRLQHLIVYHPNGKEKQEGSYLQIYIKPKEEKKREDEARGRTRRSNGIHTVKDGEWITYSTSGNVVKKEVYTKGKLIKTSR